MAAPAPPHYLSPCFPRREPWKPARDVRAKSIILSVKCAVQRRLFVHHNKHVAGQPEHRTVLKDSNNRLDVHQSITNSIVAAIEAGASTLGAVGHEERTKQRTHDWYSVLTHELGHFTGHEKRLNRQFGKRFADSPYCMEELTAELCSAFLCAELGFTVHPRPDHTHYIGHWLRVMKSGQAGNLYRRRGSISRRPLPPQSASIEPRSTTDSRTNGAR
jgi:Zincin-like metallopeptidase